MPDVTAGEGLGAGQTPKASARGRELAGDGSNAATVCDLAERGRRAAKKDVGRVTSRHLDARRRRDVSGAVRLDDLDASGHGRVRHSANRPAAHRADGAAIAVSAPRPQLPARRAARARARCARGLVVPRALTDRPPCPRQTLNHDPDRLRDAAAVLGRRGPPSPGSARVPSADRPWAGEAERVAATVRLPHWWGGAHQRPMVSIVRPDPLTGLAPPRTTHGRRGTCRPHRRRCRGNAECAPEPRFPSWSPSPRHPCAFVSWAAHRSGLSRELSCRTVSASTARSASTS
jgi:hypothetical protein